MASTLPAIPRNESMGSKRSKVSEPFAEPQETVRRPLLREMLLAEFMGTFFLVLTVGVSVAGGNSMAPVAIGLVLSVQIYTFGAVSGGFFNPAVTLAVLLSGREKITPKRAVCYAAVQFLGAVLAAFCALAATGKTFCFHYGLSRGPVTSLELEALFTMALCGTVLAAGTSKDTPNHYFGFAIGLTIIGAALACGGFDQGSFNPAVTLGANLAHYANSRGTGHVAPSAGSWAVFLLAPLLGAALAAAVFRGARAREFEPMRSAPVPPERRGASGLEVGCGLGPRPAKAC